MKRFLYVGLVVLMTACTSVQVSKVDASKHPIKRVCIQENPKVAVSDFVGVVENGFRRHGIETSLHGGTVPADCEYILTYTAERGWDITPYLDFAELRLTHKGTTIGTATYRHRGGFGFNKWAGTETKMNPVIDQLLSGF